MGHLNVLPSSSGSNIKIFAPGPKSFGLLKIENHCIICTTRLPPNNKAVEADPKLQNKRS